MNISIVFGFSLLVPLLLFIVATATGNDPMVKIAAYLCLPFGGMCLWSFVSNFRSIRDRTGDTAQKLLRINETLASLQTSPGSSLAFIDPHGREHSVYFADNKFLLDHSPVTKAELESVILMAKPYSIRIAFTGHQTSTPRSER